MTNDEITEGVSDFVKKANQVEVWSGKKEERPKFQGRGRPPKYYEKILKFDARRKKKPRSESICGQLYEFLKPLRGKEYKTIHDSLSAQDQTALRNLITLGHIEFVDPPK